ncbi:LacI family transcriptional regulator [Sulfurifustis variabilis]|uniref:LacI family transcriptional regulator n=1 Tax=Sulfurifustis variabilis TaxID=1675686 RepID=A0A1B4V1N0_9GAMM|nr:LacI family DNA-binding transcriptional regulator [Sulfurifustis variabilis]BAU47398.1 LacI family transcriptional regulator [Sulfurifustis variabilis]
MNRRPVTLIDVARAANVSIATVSRALSFPHKVSPETLGRIERTIEALGYVANGSARALASRRSRTIGALIPSLDNPSFATTVHALQRALGEAGYTVLLACHEFDPAAERRLARTLIERGVDGLVLLGTEHEPEVYALIERFRLPYVLTWALEEGGRHTCIGFDNRAAAARLTEHLLALGHRELAMISGMTANNERARERALGVREALRRSGVALDPGRFVEVPYTLQSGRDGLAQVIGQSPRPTAVICGNDLLAIGAIAECHARGLGVPEDVSVTGFDDMEIAAMLSPGLTTMHFPTQELGDLAAQQILRAIAGETVPARQELAVRLVVRGTTAPPRRGAES